MKLKILDPNNLLDKPFILWLINETRKHFLAQTKLEKLAKWDQYLNSIPNYRSIYKKKIIARDIITAGIFNLIYKETEDGFWIEINPNILTPGLDRVKLSSICKLINFGNQDLTGYPIFTDTFQYVADNISSYVDRYLLTH